MRVRIKDIADRAKVSVGTVDRVLHNRGEVSPVTRDRILAIVDEFKYEPDVLASTLASKKNYHLAVLMPKGTVDNEFWKSPIKGVHKAISEIDHFGIQVDEYLYEQKEKDSFLAQANNMIQNMPDGAIIVPFFNAEAEKLCTQLKEHAVPFVLVNSNISDALSSISFIGQNSLESGKLAGKLLHYGLSQHSHFLVVNILKDRGNYFHIFQRQRGFLDYFKLQPSHHEIHEVVINGTSKQALEISLDNFFTHNSGNVHGIFVTNSKVFKVAEYLKKNNLSEMHLLGYDLIEASMPYLEDGTIDFLIGQRPEEQGYRSLMALFNHLVLKKNVEAIQYMPLDIITKENMKYYQV